MYNISIMIFKTSDKLRPVSILYLFLCKHCDEVAMLTKVIGLYAQLLEGTLPRAVCFSRRVQLNPRIHVDGRKIVRKAGNTIVVSSVKVIILPMFFTFLGSHAPCNSILEKNSKIFLNFPHWGMNKVFFYSIV